MEALLTKTHSGSRECLVGRLLNAVEYNNANDSENDTSNAVRASESFCRNAAHSLARFVESVRIFEQRQWSSTSIRSTADSMIRLNRELNCSFLLAVRSELLEEAPQIIGFLLVLNPRKHHFGARNLRLGIFDVFLESRFVPDDPGIFVRIRVIEAWHRARLASFQAVLDWSDHVFRGFAYAMAGHTFLERCFSRGDISSNGRSG